MLSWGSEDLNAKLVMAFKKKIEESPSSIVGRAIAGERPVVTAIVGLSFGSPFSGNRETMPGGAATINSQEK